MKNEIYTVVERLAAAENEKILATKPAAKKYLKVPAYAKNNPEYIVLHEVDKLNDAYFVLLEGNRNNVYTAVFAIIAGFVFRLDEYSFEALGMAQALEEFYHEQTDNLAFNF